MKDYSDNERDRQSESSLNRALLEKEIVKSWKEITKINADAIIMLTTAIGDIAVCVLVNISMFS